MAHINREVALSLDDVLLEPQHSDINSRFSGEIDLSTEILPGVVLKAPLISSNMDTCTERALAVEMSRLGGAGVIHRFMPVEKYIKQLLHTPGIRPLIICIGAKDAGIERLEQVLNALHIIEDEANINIPVDGVLIDVAHGHSKHTCEQTKRIKDNFGLSVIAGNVATFAGAHELAEHGADCIKVGVGNGSICSTRVHTGVGVPQLTAVYESNKAKSIYPNLTVVSDGGVRNAGDIVKCLAAGADAVISGRLFSGTEESPGEVTTVDGCLFKQYRGMSTWDVQAGWKGSSQPISVEGVTSRVPYKGPVEDIFNNLVYNMLSGFSYCGAKNIKELQEKAVFVRQTSAGFRESSTHIFEK